MWTSSQVVKVTDYYRLLQWRDGYRAGGKWVQQGEKGEEKTKTKFT